MAWTLKLEDILALNKAEGWDVVKTKSKEGGVLYEVECNGENFPLAHPFAIHSKLYRTSGNPEMRYRSFKKMHDYLWPHTVWHYWTERRFQAHCENYGFISLAGGASTSKSYDVAKIALLTWFANPTERGVIIASTSLDSLASRVWGYMQEHRRTMMLPLDHIYRREKPPKVLYDKDDTINGIFAVAAKRGDDEAAISSWIGRHPKEYLLLILDEGTDMPMAITKSFSNLQAGSKNFQLIIIGNSSSQFDLHGSLSTPKLGWNSVDPTKDIMWETTYTNGVCLYFSCYESPAIHETNPEKKAELAKFLITQEEIEQGKKDYGADTDEFYRFILGFWRTTSAESTVLSALFLKAFNTNRVAEWSGTYPLRVVAGLDPAFSQGGDSCILRLALFGLATNGQLLLDYRTSQLLFRLRILANSTDSVEIQIAKQTLEILNRYNCPLDCLAVDANGQGRALAELIRLQAQSLMNPVKIYSTKVGNRHVNSFDVTIKTSLELWGAFKDYIQTDQIRGLDEVTLSQLTTRMVEKTKAGRYALESKNTYKKRMGSISPSLAHSPDEADAASLALQAAIIRFGFTPGQRMALHGGESFEDEKYAAYRNLTQANAQQTEQTRQNPLQANFSAGIESMGETKLKIG